MGLWNKFVNLPISKILAIVFAIAFLVSSHSFFVVIEQRDSAFEQLVELTGGEIHCENITKCEVRVRADKDDVDR